MTTKKNKKAKPTKPKKVAAMKTSPKKKALRKPPAKKSTPRKRALKKKTRGKAASNAAVAFDPKGLRGRPGTLSGDLQGLSGTARADSESVDELLEEGNAFEAEAVEGVQDAPDADAGEVVTHEVPEDDVPEEYLGKDQ
jgi:hypothetical protein